jgi:hypothetical protein
MPRTPVLTPHCPRDRDPLPAWEPAISQLREACPEQLNALVRQWLGAFDLTAVRRISSRPGSATYQAFIGPEPLSTPLHVRIYQRRNALQAHHVDAFLGHLVRSGVPLGILVTTGPCSRDAYLAGGSFRSPKIRLLSGDRWAAELAAHQAGVKRRSLWRWVVELRSRLWRGDDHSRDGGR